MAMLTVNWTRLKMVGNKILTWMPWRHIVRKDKLKSFYPKKLLQENVDQIFFFFFVNYSLLTVEMSWYHGIAKLIPVCRSQKLKIIITGWYGNRVPQHVHHVNPVQRGTSFPCFLLLFWYPLIIIFWTTEETVSSEDLCI